MLNSWGKFIEYTVGYGYQALIFGFVVTLVSLWLQWRFFVWVMATRRLDGQATGLGRFFSSGRPPEPTLRGLIGIDEAKASIMEIVDFLKAPERYREMGCDMPRGVLLVGGPGVGKTTLARAMAVEAGVPFIGMAAATLDEVFFGIGAMRIRAVFQRCRKLAQRSKHKSAILFIDEIDALGNRNRGFASVSGMTAGNTTLNRILTEMDGIDSTSNVIVMAATNYEEMLDPALLRPGRFDRKLYVPSPNLVARKRLFAHYLERVKAHKGLNLDRLAEMTVNFSPAEVKAAVNEAALLCVRLRGADVGQDHIESAIHTLTQQIGDRRGVGGGIITARAGDLMVRLDDVVGADEAKREARQTIELLRNASKLKDVGARMPRGLLLGLLAPARRCWPAIANEAGKCRSYSCLGATSSRCSSEWAPIGHAGLRAGAQAQSGHRVHRRADALGSRSSTEPGGGADRDITRPSTRLIELDGFGRSGVLTIAATNFEDVLDPALLRPGRFDRRIYVPLPDGPARREMLGHYLATVKHDESIDLDGLVAATTTFAGADIAHLVNQAALNALQEGRVSATSADLSEAARIERGALSSRTVGSSSIVSRITDLSVRLADVVGIEDAKRDVMEVVDLLRAPARALELGIKPPHGLLFAGPPGTGKTMLAQAMANEAGVPFYALAGSDFNRCGAASRRGASGAVYSQARRHPAAIVFIDEVMAIAAARSAAPGTLRDDNNTVDAFSSSSMDLAGRRC
jgi:ATP-dependent Zn protease